MAFVGGAFQVSHAGENECESDEADNGGAKRWQIADQQGGGTAECAKEIKRED